jgi:hypothetical protein
VNILGRVNDRALRFYIFVTSDRPDPYVNVLVYALRSHPISEVHFVAIKEHNYSNEEMVDRLGGIAASVQTRLEELSQGRYGEAVSSHIDAGWIRTYEECVEKLERIPVTKLVISWVELDSKLAKFISNGQSMFDVTTLKKNLLVDVVVLLLSRGCVDVYSFELMSAPQYNEHGLIHMLSPSDYTYRVLAESRHVDSAKKRMISRTIDFRALILLTVVIALVVVLVQVFTPNTWLQTIVIIVANATSIAAWLFGFRRNSH